MIKLRRRHKKYHIVGEEQLPSNFYLFILHFLKNYKLAIFLMSIAPLWWGINNVFHAYLVKIIINDIATSNLQFEELLTRFTFVIAAFIILPVILSATWRLYNIGELRLAPIARDINIGVLEYTENHSYKYFQDNLAGAIGNKINDIIKNTFETIHLILQSFLLGFFNLFITAGAMYIIHPSLTVLMLFWAFLFIFFSFLFSKRSNKYSKDFSEERSTLTGKMVDSVSNIMSVKLFGRNDYELSYIGNQSNKVVKKHKKFLLFKFFDFMVKDFFLFVFMTSIFLTSLYLTSKKLLTPGDFAFVFSASLSVLYSIWQLSKDVTKFMEYKGIAEQALSIIVQKQKVTDKLDAKIIQIKNGKIEFKNVKFKYSSKVTVFEDLNLTIYGGQRIGLVGFSGSGKTTFIKLILRYFDINKGEILIDTQNIKDIQQCSLRKNIGTIPQEPSLFHRSIMENIRYGKLDATNAEVIQAAKMAKCHEFITGLEDGYDTLVGERGVKLSGGQRQRIAIARVILKNAPILVLDEATSALDSVTEQCIQENLDKMAKGKTTIAVAHRLSTLLKMDRILVFDNGKIVEDGNHKELLKKNGRYKKLWNMQSDGFIPEDV
ncbi:ABC transporter ATP-binding protein [Pseudomonadota bacterium]